jgi:hypothetical protein
MKIKAWFMFVIITLPAPLIFAQQQTKLCGTDRVRKQESGGH